MLFILYIIISRVSNNNNIVDIPTSLHIIIIIIIKKYLHNIILDVILYMIL